MRLNFYDDTRCKRDDEFDTEVFVSHHVYTDNGPTYPQDRRFMRHQDLEKFDVVRCVRCNKLMTGGRYREDRNVRTCNDCYREQLLEDIIRLMDERGL